MHSQKISDYRLDIAEFEKSTGYVFNASLMLRGVVDLLESHDKDELVDVTVSEKQSVSKSPKNKNEG